MVIFFYFQVTKRGNWVDLFLYFLQNIYKTQYNGVLDCMQITKKHVVDIFELNV